MRYIDKAVPLLGRSIESYMGNVVHETLEWLYDTSINHDLATKQEVIDYYNRRWVSRWKDDIRVIKNGFDSEKMIQATGYTEMNLFRFKGIDSQIIKQF